MPSGYPDETQDRYGIPRVPAAQTAVPHTRHHYTAMQLGLAKSLACYVSDEDAKLDRRSFLENVVDRIQLDLMTGDY